MPYVDGYEICRKARGSPYKGIKIVLFTASADEDLLAKGKAAGADRILSKPFSIKQIKDTIRSVIESPELLLSTGEQYTQIYAP